MPAKHFVLLLFVAALIDTNSIAAQSRVNNTILNQALNGDDGYQLRQKDERYEGLYTRHVSGEVLDFVSCTIGCINYELRESEKLVIECRPLKTHKEIGVTGTSFGLNKNYHLDLLLKQGKKKTIPVKEVIAPKNIYPENLGIYGYVGDINEPSLYLPVRIISSLENGEENIEIIIVCNKQLTNVKWKFAPVSNNNSAVYSEGQEPVKQGPFYKAESPIKLIIPFQSCAGSEVVIAIEAKAAGNPNTINKSFKLFIPS